MAPAVCRSRGQQCTGKGKHLSLSRGISVVHGDRAFPGHTTEGMGKPGERDPTHAVLLLGTVKWGYMIGCIYQKPWNQICDVCECLQHWEVQISLKCHRTCVPSCSTLCCSLRRKVKSTCTKWGSVGKEESATVLDCSFFFPTSLGHSSCSHDFRSDFFWCLFESASLHLSTSLREMFQFYSLQDSSHFPVLLTSPFSLPCSFESSEYFWA